MKRRTFLKMTGTGLAATMLGPLTARPLRAAQSKRPPNIILLLTDEHDHRVTGCYGNKLIRTPALDRLAAEGVTFEHCYCNSPLCVPSRLSHTSGKYINRVDAWSNSCRLPDPENIDSLAHVLSRFGYQPYLCGKNHYDKRYRYGFIDLEPNFNRSNKTGRGNRREADDLTEEGGLSKRFNENNLAVRDNSTVMKHDQLVTDTAVRFLQQRSADDGPFYLHVGLLAPHFPLVAPQPYWEPYRDQVPMPQIPEGFLDRLPLNYKHLRCGFNMTNVPDDKVKLGRELYYGLTQWVDNQIDTILAALARTDFAENTVIIYTADHGENAGEHGLWWKNSMYEQSAGIPLIMHWPQRWAGGQRRSGVCSMLDVVRTIVDLAEGETPDDWNGSTLVPLLDDPHSQWPDFAVSQYYAHNIASGYAMLVQGNWKYVYHSPPNDHYKPEMELYDLAADPMEFDNLSAQPQHAQRIAQMQEFLIKQIGEHPDETEARCRAQIATGYES